MSSTHEFTDSYSDDIIFLRKVRKSLLRHPIEHHVPFILDATLARLYTVMLVGNIENCIRRIHEETEDPKLALYLKNRTNNRVKIDALRHYFEDNLGCTVASDTLEDYLAIKYLRNGIIHSNRTSQADYVKSRGFPLDCRKFTHEHFERIANVDHNMTLYLYSPQIMALLKGDRATITDVAGINRQNFKLTLAENEKNTDLSRPYSRGEVITFHRNQLDRVGTSWMKRKAELGSEAMSETINKIRANDESPYRDEFIEWGMMARYSWNELIHLTQDDRAVLLCKDSTYRTTMLRNVCSLALQGELHQHREEVRRPRTVSTPPEDAEIFECLAAGYSAYEIIPQFSYHFIWPVLIEGNSPESTEFSQMVIDIFELGNIWYSITEPHSPLYQEYSEALSFCRQEISRIST